jgi:CBS domain-containing protein
MAQAPEMIQENQPLPEAIKLMNQMYIEQIPVASRTKPGVIVGILDRQIIKRAVNKKIVALGTAQA